MGTDPTWPEANRPGYMILLIFHGRQALPFEGKTADGKPRAVIFANMADAWIVADGMLADRANQAWDGSPPFGYEIVHISVHPDEPMWPHDWNHDFTVKAR